jgi:integral membrane sensor domain MASE1
MPQKPSREAYRKPRGDPMPPWIGAIGLTIATGVAYFFAARLSLALLAKSGGLALFWLGGGVSSGVLIAFGRDARLPVVCAVMAATIATLTGDRDIRVSVALASCNAGEALLAAWLIERYFGSNFSLNRLRNVLGLLAAAVISTAASGIAATAAYRLLTNPATPIWSTWQHWFASGAVGIITVAPLVIGVAETLRAPPRRSGSSRAWRRS